MFIHGRTGEKIYSVREKINHYKGILKQKHVGAKKREYAEMRLQELQWLNEQSYSEPTMIVTDDKHFGNKISKPRGCVVVGKDNKNRLIVCPVHKRTTKSLVLDNDISRQVEVKGHKISDSEVYELKYIDGLKELTKNDQCKIREIFSKK